MRKLLLPCLLLLTGHVFGQQAESVTVLSDPSARMGCGASIVCPSNITVYADPGQCSAVVTYPAPVTSTTCGSNITTTFNYVSTALQTFTVPANVTSVRITATGAQGGSVTTTCAATGGLGAYMAGTFAVTTGEVLSILVGQQGFTNGADAGGGGGSFVVRAGNVPLLIAGGGGGATNNIGQCGSNRNGLDATLTTSGTASANGLVAGGTGGNGGGASGGSGGGGGGFLTNGAAGSGNAPGNGKAYVNGGAGGTGVSANHGGYGGGGCGWQTGGNGGGGGGYSGGSTSGNQPYTGGGGGGSYNIGTNPFNFAAYQTGNGQVTIQYTVPVPLFTTLVQGGASGSTFPVGTTTVEWSVTDNNNPAVNCSFTVTVLDTVSPVITCPGNVVVGTAPGTCTAVATYAAVTATDACPGMTLIMTAGDTSGASFPVGVNTVTYEAEDSSANLSSCSFTVTVVNNDSSSQSFTICDGEAITVGTNTYTTSGTYSDTLQNGGGCDSVITTLLTVKPPVNTATTVNGGTITATQVGATYQWIDCGTSTAVPGATNQGFTPTANGTYSVMVTLNGCTDTSACAFVVGVDGRLASQVTLFPNPTSGRVQLDFGTEITEMQIEVFDIAGKRILLQDERNAKSIQLDLSSFQNGVYFLKLSTSEGQEVLRVVKQN